MEYNKNLNSNGVVINSELNIINNYEIETIRKIHKYSTLACVFYWLSIVFFFTFIIGIIFQIMTIIKITELPSENKQKTTFLIFSCLGIVFILGLIFDIIIASSTSKY